MSAYKVFSALLKKNPNAAQHMITRLSHDGGIVIRNSFPRAGPNPFAEPEWFFHPVHRVLKKVMVISVILVCVDVRYTGNYRANGTPFTIQMINTLFPGVQKRYAHHGEHGGHH